MFKCPNTVIGKTKNICGDILIVTSDKNYSYAKKNCKKSNRLKKTIVLAKKIEKKNTDKDATQDN